MKKLLFKVSLVAGLMLLVPYYLLGGGTMPGFLQDIFKSGKEAVAADDQYDQCFHQYGSNAL